MASPPRIVRYEEIPLILNENLTGRMLDSRDETRGGNRSKEQVEVNDQVGKSFNSLQGENRGDINEPVFNLPTPVPATNRKFGPPLPIHMPRVQSNILGPALIEPAREQTFREGNSAPKTNQPLLEIYAESPNSKSLTSESEFKSEPANFRKRPKGECSSGPAPKKNRTLVEIDENSERAINLPKAQVHSGTNAGPVKKESITADDQQVLSDQDLEIIFAKRSLLTSDKDDHNLNLYRLDTEVRHRYREKDFKFEEAESRKLRRQNQVNNPQHMDPLKCRHRLRVPTLTIVSCSHCGKQHKDPEDCAILRYHSGSNLFESDREILEHFPCTYCNSFKHTTRVCMKMHSLCKDCHVRGHGPFNKKGRMTNIEKGKVGKCYITPELFEEYRVKFKKLSKFGIHTHKASSEYHRWGFKVPESHLCNKADWSDSEDEEDLTVPHSNQISKGPLLNKGANENTLACKDPLLNDADLQAILLQLTENLWYRERRGIYTEEHMNIPIRERYRFEHFKFDLPSERKPSKQFGNDELHCRHRQMRVMLTRHSCTHCGKSHKCPEDCAIVRYQQGGDLFESDRPILEQYPCAYCHDQRHTTLMCNFMQAYCKTCKVRGHPPIRNGKILKKPGSGKCVITPEQLNDFIARFNRFSSKGIHSRKSQGNFVHKWGMIVPENHVCSEKDWSDTDDES